jgi:hypothetical protein
MLIIACACFVLFKFLFSCVPLRYFRLSRLSTLLRVHPPLLWFVKHYYRLQVLRLRPYTLCPFVRSGVQCFKRFYGTIAYSTTAGSPDPDLIRPAAIFSNGEGQRMRADDLSVSPGGFIPDAVDTSGNF